MSKGEKKLELEDALARIEKTLSSMQKSIIVLEKRISDMEQLFDKKSNFSGGNPLIFSKVLMGTLEAIRDYEKKEHHGIVPKDLARIRNVGLPTIYDQLSKLSEAQLVIWQRGIGLGLKPHNAKFYSVKQRDERLSDLPILMSLPEYVMPIAQSILKSSSNGVSKKALLRIVQSLKEQDEKIWKKVSSIELEQRVSDAVQFLLCRVLITKKGTPDDEYYYVQE
ncbi:MAG: hypothetical protein ACTSUO_09725 [Candidatus Thorarchaeota archaeon]